MFFRAELGRIRILLVEEMVKVCYLFENGCSVKGRNICMYRVRDMRECVKNIKIKKELWVVGFGGIND